jgi:beta-1,4-mannosyl-glycoprotein beta-1,4-N-acetylglucosaminyltransferase
MNKIYDCFPFYNELDLLELRLSELYDYVDHFVLVEANTTHQSNPKPYYFEDNKSRYARYLDKIIHIKVDNMPGHADAWVNEKHHRDQIMQGIDRYEGDENDLVFISDLDEIIRPKALEHIVNSPNSLFALRMSLHNFKFNYLRTQPGQYDIWGMAVRKSLIDKDFSPTEIRRLRFNFMQSPYQFKDSGIEVVEHGGWHFGYMGDNEWLINKAKNFAHAEVNRPEFIEQIDVEKSIAERREWNRGNANDRYEIVELDSYFPRTILENQDQYQQFILKDSVAKALDFLPAYPYNS